MIAKVDFTRAYLVDAAGVPPEIFSTWDGTLRTLVGIVVGLSVGITVGHIHRRRQLRRQEDIYRHDSVWRRPPPEGWGRRPGPR
jgi:hypothetical protein